MSKAAPKVKEVAKKPEKQAETKKSEKKVEQEKPSKLTRFSNYLRLSRAELYKVSWPSFKETKTTSFVVLGFVVVMSILLGLVDLGLSSLIGLILS